MLRSADLCEIDGGNLAQILAAAERSECELDRRPPFPEIPRQGLRAGHIRFAASGFGDGAIGAHDAAEEILHLALARVAPRDAKFLAGRRGINFEAASRRKLRHRIDVGSVQPMCAEIVGQAECSHVGDTAPAHAGSGFEQNDALPGCREAARGGNPGCSRADNHDIDVGGLGNAAQRRHRDRQSGSGEK